MTNSNDSLIEKLEAKICGNYTAKEAYGRGLDSGLQIAIEIIRQHTAQSSEIPLPSPTRYTDGTVSREYEEQPVGSALEDDISQAIIKMKYCGYKELPDYLANVFRAIRPYLRQPERESVGCKHEWISTCWHVIICKKCMEKHNPPFELSPGETWSTTG